MNNKQQLQEQAEAYLQMRLIRIKAKADKILAQTTGMNSGISIDEIHLSLLGIPNELGVNWSAMGTQDANTAAAFAQALAEITKLAHDFNQERAEIIAEIEEA